MKTAAIYCRVSSAGQARDGTSLTTQLAACEVYAQAGSYTVLKAIQEDASGGRLDRTGLDQVRDLAERGELQALIVYESDRLTRDLGHLMMLVEEFRRNRVELVFVNAPHENTPEGMMLLQMRGMFAQYERTKIQERSRRGKKRRAHEGKVMTSWAAPYGYTYIRGEGRFDVVPTEAHWVVKIFEWYVKDCLSLRSIVRLLNEEGVPTQQGAKSWAQATIGNILVNTSYTGRWFYNKSEAVTTRNHRSQDGTPTKREKSTQVRKPQSEWIEVPIPAIVPLDLFEAVPARMVQNTNLSQRNCKTEYLLRGLLTCAQCGWRISARRGTDRHGKEFTQYYCTGRYDEGLRATCKMSFPGAAKLDARVWDRLVLLLSDEERIEETLRNHAALRSTERKREDNELLDLQSQEQKVSAEEARWLDAYAKGAIDVEQLEGRMLPIRKQKEALKKVRAELHERMQQRDVAQAQQGTIKRLVAQAKRGLPFVSFEDKRAFLEAVSFKGVVDGAKDMVYIDGLLTTSAMSLSGKGETEADVSSRFDLSLRGQFDF